MGLVDRVKNILLQPNAEWAVINTELTNTATLYKTYIIPLAAIGPEDLFREALSAVKAECGLTETERKN